jgi:hypothetical protein
MVVQNLAMDSFQVNFNVRIISYHTNKFSELSADILDGGMADSSYLERLTEVSVLLIERLSLS